MVGHDDDSYIVSDSFCSNQFQKLYVERLKNWNGRVYSFERNVDNINSLNSLEEISLIAKSHQLHDYTDDIERIREHILESLSEILCEISSTGAQYDMTLYALQTIADQKRAYTEYLSYLESQIEEIDLKEMKNDYLQIGDMFKELKILMIKHAITNRVDRQAVSAKFDKMIDIERNTTYKYMNVLQGIIR